MDCALWLNRRKIFSADEICGNLDIAALRGYFLAGSLCDWLRSHGGAEYAAQLELLDTDSADLNKQILRIFGGEPVKNKALPADYAPPLRQPSSGSFSGSFGSLGSGSFRLGSFGRYLLSTSFYGGSLRLREWEWEWLWRRGGSFRAGSFAFGSGIRPRFFGSGAALGSYRFGSPPSVCGSFSCFLGGSESPMPSSDEYDRIMLQTLMSCPLNQFGYGIHNI